MAESFPRKFGKYYLLSPLAQGGMGALYLATTGDRDLEKLCVIKTVLPHLADSEYVARFRDEAKVVVRLSHGNLVPVFDAGQAKSEIFLAMDFVEGKDLRAVWNRCAKKAIAFPVDVAVYIVKELCRGLAYAHSFSGLELVHRDVSPPNVLLSYTGEVRLTDFGLASSTLKLEKTSPGVIYGKVSYMSPEQARGEKLDSRTDLYAAGIILWELLTGRQLFPSGEAQASDLLARARDPKIDPPSKRASRVPASLDLIVLKALATNAAQRYQTGEEMRAALAGFLASEAPATDSDRVSGFMSQLFDEDIVRERAEREQLIVDVRAVIEGAANDKKPKTPSGGVGPSSPGAQDSQAQSSSQSNDESDDPSLPKRRRTDVDPSSMPKRRSSDQFPTRIIRPIKQADVGNTTQQNRPGPPPPPAAALTPALAASPLAAAAAKAELAIKGKAQPLRAVAVAEARPNAATVIKQAAQTAEAQPELSSWSEESASVIGGTIDGRYRIIGLIGEGGMGRVYDAEHIEIGKHVALKILHPVYSRTTDVVERFRREARAASRIGHPNIVDVTDSGQTTDGSVYFAMELLEGIELAEVIDRDGAMPVARALPIAQQICRALRAAHDAGIIHRDLKPENIFLVVREGTADFVKVLDFGIAKIADLEEPRGSRLTHPGMAMGTPEYMAPEQAAGKPADQRSDIYAVGAILYEMLAGVAPYKGDNFMEILSKKASLEPRPLREVAPEVSAAVEQVVMRSMSRKPEDRPQSMEAMEYELTKCVAGRGFAVSRLLGLPAEHGDGVIGDGRSHQERESQRTQAFQIAENEQRSRRTWMFAGTFAAAALAAAAIVWPRSRSHVSSSLSGPQTKIQENIAPVPPPVDHAALLTPDGSVSGDAVLAPSSDGKQGANTGVPATSGGQNRSASGADGATQNGANRAGSAQGNSPSNSVGNGPSDSQPKHGKQEPAKLLKQARSLEAGMQWSDAREAYERLLASGAMRGAALTGLASVAWQTKDLARTVDLAKQAIKAGGGLGARMLLGHAYFKKREFSAAIEQYEAVLASSPENREAQTALTAAKRQGGIE